MNIMKTKNLVIASLVLTVGIGALYFWLERKNKLAGKIDKEPTQINEQPGWKLKTPEELLKRLIGRILEEGVWKNERDFLSTLTKLYIKEAIDISWIDYLPTCQEDLLWRLGELDYLEEYERELEKRYKK